MRQSRASRCPRISAARSRRTIQPSFWRNSRMRNASSRCRKKSAPHPPLRVPARPQRQLRRRFSQGVQRHPADRRLHRLPESTLPCTCPLLGTCKVVLRRGHSARSAERRPARQHLQRSHRADQRALCHRQRACRTHERRARRTASVSAPSATSPSAARIGCSATPRKKPRPASPSTAS